MTRFKINLEDLQKVDPNISVVLKKYMLREISEKIKSQNKSIRQFSKIIGCSPMFLCGILSGKMNLKLELLQRIEKALNTKLMIFIDKVTARCSSSFIPIGKFPILATPSLASLVGHSLGDGHISKLHFHYTNLCDKLIEDVIMKANDLSVRNFTVNKRFHNGTNLQFPKLIRNILLLAGAPMGSKTRQSFWVPDWIKKGPTDVKRAFSQALFDDEASVLKSREIVINMHKSIELKDNLHEFFEEIKSLLESVGIDGITIKEGYLGNNNNKTIRKVLRICGISNFIGFQKEINFIHPDKKEKLNRMINNFQRIQLRRFEGQTKIIRILKTKGRLNTSEIAKGIGISPGAVLRHLKKLEKNNKINRTKPSNNKKPHVWCLVSSIK